MGDECARGLEGGGGRERGMGEKGRVRRRQQRGGEGVCTASKLKRETRRGRSNLNTVVFKNPSLSCPFLIVISVK